MFKKFITLLAMALFVSTTAFAQTNYYDNGTTANVVVLTEYQKSVAGQPFILDGSKSQDDSTVKTYNWKQVSGPFRFTMPSGAKISITPSVVGTYVFELIVTDATGLSSTAKKIQLDVAVAATTSTTTNTGGTEDINIGVGESESKKGNVEYNWKVEEGEKAEEKENDRLVNAGPTTDWPDKGVSVAAGDINGLTEEEKQEFLTSVKVFAEVKSGQDLENFAAGVLIKDVQIKGIKIMENAIDLDYAMPAKLFGMFSTTYVAKVSINRGENENWDFGNVKVKLPWYSFLLKKGVSADEITNTIKQEKTEEDETLDDFGKTAKVITTVSNVLKTKHDTAKNSIGNIR